VESKIRIGVYVRLTRGNEGANKKGNKGTIELWERGITHCMFWKIEFYPFWLEHWCPSWGR